MKKILILVLLMLRRLRQQLRPSSLTGRLGRHIERLRRKASKTDKKVVRLAPAGEPIGRALFSYIVDPFLLAPDAELPLSHTHFWESRTIAETLRELGFTVDAMHWSNSAFEPTERYDLLIDGRGEATYRQLLAVLTALDPIAHRAHLRAPGLSGMEGGFGFGTLRGPE